MRKAKLIAGWSIVGTLSAGFTYFAWQIIAVTVAAIALAVLFICGVALIIDAREEK